MKEKTRNGVRGCYTRTVCSRRDGKKEDRGLDTNLIQFIYLTLSYHARYLVMFYIPWLASHTFAMPKRLV